MSVAMLWIIAGIVLILSELLLTSVVAVFLGVAAIITGLLVHWQVIDQSAIQFAVFGIISLALLFTARGQIKRWFSGYSDTGHQGQRNFQRDIGSRVTVNCDFNQGAGRVTLNGVQWDAFSDDALKAGDTAWVIANEGIQLTVAAQPLQASAATK